MKKIAVVGKGTAGCMSAAYWSSFEDVEVDWYFDPNIKTQAVGEGANLTLPTRLNETVNFSPREFHKADASLKTGIYKDGWGKGKKPFLHDFPSPFVSMHFNAIKLQDYIEECMSNKDRVNIKRMNVDPSNIDASFIVDASGKPSEYSKFVQSPYIPVNSVYVTQCYWEYPRFNYTLTIARPYGWVFGIPLQNRCSIGYMYNKDINTLEEVQEDVKHIFEQYNLIPSEDTNAFSFNNYKRIENYNENIVYNGNASFFLEPLEATSFGSVDAINKQSGKHWFQGHGKKSSERHYNSIIDSTENIIMMHYAAGSDYVSDFWEYAEERGQKCLENSNEACHALINGTHKSLQDTPELKAMLYSWWYPSWEQNSIELGLRNGS